jgi:RimJ/RimL family protein N-acetyltransferase
MDIDVTEMKLDEVGVVIDYFYNSTPEHLETMGVDPTRLLPRAKWREYYTSEYGKPIEQRETFMVIWKAGRSPIGFSTVNKVVYGDSAFMHLHVLEPEHRQAGIGAACVRKSVAVYFETLKLQRLFCEPNAFNVAPNRTLQSVGFKYVKTYKTVPGPLNFHQAVTRWVLESPSVSDP